MALAHVGYIAIHWVLAVVAFLPLAAASQDASPQRPRLRIRGSIKTDAVAHVQSLAPAAYPGISLAERNLSKHHRQPKLLLFWACGSKDIVIDLVKANVRHARRELGRNVHVYLVHYDRKRIAWQRRVGKKWYSENVDFSSSGQGYKTELMLRLLNRENFNLQAYDWVWSLDEDVDFTKTNLRRLLATADETGSLITMPAFTEVADGSGDAMSYPFQSPHSECDYRYVPMLEAIFPLLRPAVIAVLDDCDHCYHEHSVWGMCRVWCAWSAKRLGKAKETACAVLDQDTVIHKNFKTLKDKYSANVTLPALLRNKVEDPNWIAASQFDMTDVKNHHVNEFWSPQVLPANWTCIGQKGKVEQSESRVSDWMSKMNEFAASKKGLVILR